MKMKDHEWGCAKTQKNVVSFRTIIPKNQRFMQEHVTL